MKFNTIYNIKQKLDIEYDKCTLKMYKYTDC